MAWQALGVQGLKQHGQVGGQCADEVSDNVGWGQGDGREGARGSWSGRERGVIDAEFSWTGARACC